MVLLEEGRTESIAHLNEVRRRLCSAEKGASSKPADDAKPGKGKKPSDEGGEAATAAASER